MDNKHLKLVDILNAAAVPLMTSSNCSSASVFNNGVTSSKSTSLETNLCTQEVLDYLPSCVEFFHNLGVAGWFILAVASVALIIICSLSVINLLHVYRHVHPKFMFSTGLVLSIYPVLGLCMYLEILFPKANFVLDASAHLWFVLCMYQFFKLTISYFGGETRFVRSFEGNMLPWKGVPCCFWPCVWPFLPKGPVNKEQVRLLRILIIQHPFVQAIFTIIGVTFFVEDWFESKMFSPTNANMYLYIITTVSFFFALWAFIVCFKASRTKLKNFKYCGKIASFQLSLVFLRLQSIIFNLILLPSGAIPCIPPISPKVLTNLLLCCLVLGQLVILSVMANHYYRLSVADRRDFDPKQMDNGELESEKDLKEDELPLEYAKII